MAKKEVVLFDYNRDGLPYLEQGAPSKKPTKLEYPSRTVKSSLTGTKIAFTRGNRQLTKIF